MTFSVGRTSRRSWPVMALICGCMVGLMLLSGCGKKGAAKTPEGTVESFFDAVKDKDIDAMLACFAPDIREVFEEMMEIQGKDKVREQLSGGKEKIGKLKILDTKIAGDWADVETSVMVDGKEQKDTLKLHKIDGAWYVDMPEEDKKGMKEMMKMMKDPKMKKMMEGMAEGMAEGMEEMLQDMPEPPTE